MRKLTELEKRVLEKFSPEGIRSARRKQPLSDDISKHMMEAQKRWKGRLPHCCFHTLID